MDRRRVAMGGLALLLVWSLVEGIGFLAGAWWTHSLAPVSVLAARREDLRRDLARVERPASWGPEVPRLAVLNRHHEVHPYVGFALAAPGTQRTQGFYGPPIVPPSPDPTEAHVALLGGSVALGLYRDAGARLAAGLEGLPVFRGRRVVLHPLALPGFKEPQPLLALTFFLTLGAPLDGVLTLDGFNEVVLPATENMVQGVHPAFPRSWASQVAGHPSAEVLRLVGRADLLRERRADLAALFSLPLLRTSPLANAIWALWDERLGRRASNLQHRLSKLTGPGAESLPGWIAGPPLPPLEGRHLSQYLVDLWARSTRQLDGLCRLRGLTCAFFLQPNQYDPGSKPLSDRERARFYLPDHPVATWVARGYPLLRAAGAALTADGVPFVDLSRVFADHRETLYKDTCCHVNRRGYELLADAMVAHLAASAASGAPRHALLQSAAAASSSPPAGGAGGDR